jgi:hypothetical protein
VRSSGRFFAPRFFFFVAVSLAEELLRTEAVPVFLAGWVDALPLDLVLVGFFCTAIFPLPLCKFMNCFLLFPVGMLTVAAAHTVK